MWSKAKKAPAARGDLSAFIDEGSEIEGKYSFNGTVMINGKFRGEIASSDTLIVAEKGVVHANVRTGILIVSGEVVGDVAASERVELKAGARLIGDVESPIVVIEEGVMFEGHCRMTKAGASGPSSDRPRASRPEAVSA
jgi:cytoskeletal protein CcmA (bactofilin family)